MSARSDNSSVLQGHIKLLQGRLFNVLFLVPLCTGFMSKKIFCHFQFLQHYSDKNQSLRKSLMSEVSSKQSNKYCSSQLVFSVLVVLPEISLTPSALCCQKNFMYWSFSFLPLLFFFSPSPPLFLFFSSQGNEGQIQVRYCTIFITPPSANGFILLTTLHETL